ncbi:MAG: SpoIIE family protein phosphatase [Magnetococcales bacterium]|nr:SpoIIE family protein phosphatase [Magnetococcales bacterium]
MSSGNQPEDITILAVDDTPENLDIIKGVLTPDYRLKAAINGPMALKVARITKPDLILLDIMMPEMDGYEVCRRLKEDRETRDIPVIFVTAMDQEGDELQGLDLGAVDYITKPISPAILKARITTHLALKQARQELEQKNQLLREERALVETIVDKMRTDIHMDCRYLRFITEALEKTSGDVIFSAFRPDGGQHVLLGDFTGHGLPAAVGGPLISNIFYSRTQDGVNPLEILLEFNRVLYEQLPLHIFMAATLVEVTPQRDALHVWNCGLPDALLINNEGTSHAFFSSNPPLGIVPDLLSEEGERTDWSSDSRLFVYSDGLTETVDHTNTMFGSERLQALLTRTLPPHGELTMDDVLAEIDAFSDNQERSDDMTLLELCVE